MSLQSLERMCYCGSQVVSVLAFYCDDMSLHPIILLYYCFRKEKKLTKRGLGWPIFFKKVLRETSGLKIVIRTMTDSSIFHFSTDVETFIDLSWTKPKK